MSPSGSPTESTAEPEPARPMLRVVRGEPTAEEMAALVAVLAARAAAAAAPGPTAEPSPWQSRRAQLSKPVFVGPGEWRRSGWDNGTRTRADW